MFFNVVNGNKQTRMMEEFRGCRHGFSIKGKRVDDFCRLGELEIALPNICLGFFSLWLVGYLSLLLVVVLVMYSK